MFRQGRINHNPAADLELPKAPKALPRALNEDEIQCLLAQPNTNDDIGLRDRAMMETLYSTGLRRFELLRIKIYDVDDRNGWVWVRQGKGKKDRVVPIGRRALHWIRQYLRCVRPHHARNPDEGFLFLSKDGGPLKPISFDHRLRKYKAQAQIKKPGLSHLFRHSMATHMLKNGADLSSISEILGHASLTHTQLYTKVSIQDLQRIHAQTHPAG